jgi:pyrroloquinoline quinone (PQQ) biosynthesis protein C
MMGPKLVARSGQNPAQHESLRQESPQDESVQHVLAPAIQIVEEYEAKDVAAHPLFARLRAEPVRMDALWLLVANMNKGISPNFVRWLGLTVARVRDNRIASLVAKQLNDELGNGDFQRIHSVLLARFVAGLERWRPQHAEVNLLRAGERLGERATGVFEAAEPFEAVGGLMVAEVFAKKMDRCLGDEIRRQNQVSRDDLLWLEIHEVLEEDHAEDSRALAELVPAQGPYLASTWHGARELWAAMWSFLDDVGQLAFAPRAS